MKLKIANLGKLAFHPVLFGFYPTLALYLFNITEINFSGIKQALITSGVVDLVFIVFFLLVFRKWEKASGYISLTILFFFFYGHIFDLVGGFSENIARHRYFIPLWILFFVAGVVFIYRVRSVIKLTNTLNIISFILILSVFVQISIYKIQAQFALQTVSENPETLQQPDTQDDVNDRDVYYILVDTFGREDLLSQAYQLDISSFTSQLKELGFYIPECAQSNYDYTAQSLVSSLNMQYLNMLGLDYYDDRGLFAPYMQHGIVRNYFEKLNYSTITFKSLYPALDIKDSTYYYDYFKDETGLANLASLNFQYLFLRTTAIRPWIEFLESKPEIVLPSFWATWIPVGGTLAGRDYRQYQQNVYALSTLETIPELPGKKFVYAHLYIMHQPFVFYPDGRFHPNLLQDDAAYRDQVVFSTGRLLEIVQTILQKSQRPPIIMIQGDHSYANLQDRTKIFNAYYFPDGGDVNLYRTITPVNSFRVLFNTYYNGKYELLPDISRYDDHEQLYETPLTCMDGLAP